MPPYLTPKLKVMLGTLNLAAGWCLSKFFKKIGFEVDDVIIVTLRPYF